MEVLVFIDTVYDNVVNYRIGFWDQVNRREKPESFTEGTKT